MTVSDNRKKQTHNNAYNTDHMLDTLLHLAYTILDYYKMPVGLQYNIEGYVYGRKIHMMMEVAEDDNRL